MNTPSPGSAAAILKIDCPIKIVDIGANPIDGKPPYLPLMASGSTKVVGFEPNPTALAELNSRKGPNETYLPYAIGDGNLHTLRICQAPGMTSLLQPNEKVISLFHGFPEWGKVLSTETIDTARLDDIPETAHLDLLKIDIQGGELMAFKNAIERLKHCVLIHTEVEFLQMYVDQPLFSDVDQFLRQQGFMLHRFEPLTSRVLKPIIANNSIYSGLSQLFWADAVFIRDIVHLEHMTTDQLLRLAVILHDCYQSYDVALHLLTEYDRRIGTKHGEDYLKAVTGAA